MKHYNIFWLFWVGVILIVVLTTSGVVYIPIIPTFGNEQPIDYSPEAKHGTIKSYDKQGNLHTVITYNHGVKDGKAFIYYENGQVMLEMNYKRGKRQGPSKKYYKDGSLYANTPYDDDKLTGIRKVYYYTGQLKAEIPYLNNEPCLGLKEYSKDGNIKKLPEFSVKYAYDAQKVPYLLLTIDNCDDAQFYVGKLASGDWLDFAPGMVSALPRRNNTHYLKLENKPESVNIICMCKTRSGSPYISQRKIEL